MSPVAAADEPTALAAHARAQGLIGTTTDAKLLRPIVEAAGLRGWRVTTARPTRPAAGTPAGAPTKVMTAPSSSPPAATPSRGVAPPAPSRSAPPAIAAGSIPPPMVSQSVPPATAAAVPTAGDPASSFHSGRHASLMPIAQPAPEPVPVRRSARSARSARAARRSSRLLRRLGFAALTLVTLALAGYLANIAFYSFSDHWIVPATLSPSHEQVAALQVQLAEQQHVRERIAGELQQAERELPARQAIHADLVKAIRRDLDEAKLALTQLRALADEAAQPSGAVRSPDARLSSPARATRATRPTNRKPARPAAPTRSTRPSPAPAPAVANRGAQLEAGAAELEAKTHALEAILAGTLGDATPALDYELLRIKQSFEAARLDLAKATQARDTLRAALARQDQLITSLEQSAYLRAARDRAPAAFVPRASIPHVQPGTPLHACKLGLLLCRRVGEVRELLPDEVQFRHPHRDRNLRGRIALLSLAPDANAADADVLFLGGAPLLF
jgi:hypothetical protein